MSGNRLIGVLASLALVVGVAAAPAAQAKTLKIAGSTDIPTLDPHAKSDNNTLSFLMNIYEGLVRRDANLKLQPALAVSWQHTSKLTYRFKLRPNVKFQDGTPFTADDVVFSFKRASGKGSNMQTYFATVKAVRKINDYHVEVDTNVPDPLLASKWAQILIMSKAWCEKHNAVNVGEEIKKADNLRHAACHGHRAVHAEDPRAGRAHRRWCRNPYWWDKPQHNLAEVDFTPIHNAAHPRRGAALGRDRHDLHRCRPRTSPI